MSTITIPESGGLEQFDIPDAAIAAMASEYMPLTISGIEDVDGFKIVHTARMLVKNKRVEVEKTRKALKADALKYGQMVDAEAKRITALLKPIEDHLEGEEKRIEAEKDAIRNASRLKAEAESRAKAEAEAAALKAAQEAEAARLAQERANLEAERATMEEERRRIEAERLAEAARLRVEQENIDAERKALEAAEQKAEQAERDRLHLIEVEKERKEAAEKARIETELRIAREAAEKQEREEAAKADAEAARIRAEALKPDKDRLMAVADQVESIIGGINVTTQEGRYAAESVGETLAEAAITIRRTVAQMLPGTESDTPF